MSEHDTASGGEAGRGGERRSTRRGLIAGAAAMGVGGLAGAAAGAPGGVVRRQNAASAKLAVLWTSADPDVAHRVALMYTHAAKTQGWFADVELIAWGPAQRTLVGDKDLRAKIAEMRGDGVRLRACVVCADSFGVADDLREIGFTVIPMGSPLTAMLKHPLVSVITF